MREAPDAGNAPVHADRQRTDPAEDLVGNTRLALARAPALCRAAPGHEACDWYHGFYPLLRLVGAAATPERHAGFYARALRPLARHGDFDRVLIPGAADSGMLRSVVSIHRAAGAQARIRVLDRCETPLTLCQDFARRCGGRIETQVFDLLGGVSPGATRAADRRFDVACTHSLLAFFPPSLRRQGIEACRAWLRPGGRLVTTARIDPAASEAGTRFGPAAAPAFAARIRDAAVAHAAALDVSPDAIFEQALRYADRMLSWPYASAHELVADLEASGFALEHLDVVSVRGRLAPGVSGGGTHQPATYAEFVATRV